MKLKDIINDSNRLVKERINYIFNAFQREFPDVYYDERKSIVGIGEKNRNWMCYFKMDENGEVLVKFMANNKPCSLLEDVENINSYIDDTIQLFKTKDLFRGKLSKINDANNQEVEVGVESKDLDELIQEIVSTKGEVRISAVASRRLNNALYKAGVKKISDLNGWTCLKLMGIRFFGPACIEELYYVLSSLKTERLDDATDDGDLKYLHKQATKWMIKAFSQKENVKKYLSLIQFDENQFDAGTIGRVLCLREKVQNEINIRFCEDDDKLYQSYFNYIDEYPNFIENTKKFLAHITNQAVLTQRDKDIVLSLLGVDGKKYTMQDLGNRYNITKERVRQIFEKELIRLSHCFDLYSEEGILRFVSRQNYLKSFADCPVDAFILYLTIEKQEYILKALCRVLLLCVSVSKEVKDRVEATKNMVNKKDKNVVVVKDDTINYNGFQVIFNEDGEILTDLELLDKLKKERLNLANKIGIPAYCVYHNTHLVLLATFKPTTKTMYASLKGLTGKTWDNYGSVMAEIIKEHINNSTSSKN